MAPEDPAQRRESVSLQLPDDPDIRGSLPALRRAARHARELAERTGTPCWIMRDGRIVDAVSGREAPEQPAESKAGAKD